jgi:hypothetical protein
VQVRVFPAEGDLQSLVKLRDAVVARHQLSHEETNRSATCTPWSTLCYSAFARTAAQGFREPRRRARHCSVQRDEEGKFRIALERPQGVWRAESCSITRAPQPYSSGRVPTRKHS